MTETNRKATLTLDGKSYDIPVTQGTLGPDVLDIRKLYGDPRPDPGPGRDPGR